MKMFFIFRLAILTATLLYIMVSCVPRRFAESASPAQLSQAEAVGRFHFADPVPCELLPAPGGDTSYRKECVASQPKKWTLLEIEEMKSHISTFYVSIPNFVSKIVEKGPIKLHRVTTFVRWNNQTQEYDSASAQSGQHRPGQGLYFSDFGLGAPPIVSETLGFSRVSLLLLHEMAHAFDHQFPERKISETDEFFAAAGWQKNPLKVIGVDLAEFKESEKAYFGMLAQKRFAEGIRIQLEFGQKYGLPTLYALTSPAECFAEVVTWFFHDPKSKSYLRPEIREYLQTNVMR